jgi:hypothetical protein
MQVLDQQVAQLKVSSVGGCHVFRSPKISELAGGTADGAVGGSVVWWSAEIYIQRNATPRGNPI